VAAVAVAAVSIPKSQFVLKAASSLLRNIGLMKFELEDPTDKR
jgi:hypothetical protein